MADQNPGMVGRPAPYASPSTSTGYEFSVTENAMIKDLAQWLMLLAVFGFVLGLMKVLVQHQAAGGLFDLLVAILMVMASTAFKRIVTTQGNDVANLMQALDRFSLLLLLRSIITILAVLVMGAGVVGLFTLRN